MVLKLLKSDDPKLRQRSNPVEYMNPSYELLMHDLRDTRACYCGLGLAAPQVGRLVRMFALNINKLDKDSTLHIDGRQLVVRLNMPRILINPVIECTGFLDSKEEGCLSLPDVRKYVKRFKTVKVTALDYLMRPVALTATGLLARVIQHEVDHLNGILITDK